MRSLNIYPSCCTERAGMVVDNVSLYKISERRVSSLGIYGKDLDDM